MSSPSPGTLPVVPPEATLDVSLADTKSTQKSIVEEPDIGQVNTDEPKAEALIVKDLSSKEANSKESIVNTEKPETDEPTIEKSLTEPKTEDANTQDPKVENVEQVFEKPKSKESKTKDNNLKSEKIKTEENSSTPMEVDHPKTVTKMEVHDAIEGVTESVETKKADLVKGEVNSREQSQVSDRAAELLKREVTAAIKMYQKYFDDLDLSNKISQPTISSYRRKVLLMKMNASTVHIDGYYTRIEMARTVEDFQKLLDEIQQQNRRARQSQEMNRLLKD